MQSYNMQYRSTIQTKYHSIRPAKMSYMLISKECKSNLPRDANNDPQHVTVHASCWSGLFRLVQEFAHLHFPLFQHSSFSHSLMPPSQISWLLEVACWEPLDLLLCRGISSPVVLRQLNACAFCYGLSDQIIQTSSNKFRNHWMLNFIIQKCEDIWYLIIYWTMFLSTCLIEGENSL